MKSIFLRSLPFILLAVSFCQPHLSAKSQNKTDSLILKSIPVTVATNYSWYEGYLESAKDSSITISSVQGSHRNYMNANILGNKYRFKVDEIQSITIYRKNNRLRGALIGLGIGTLVGILLSPREAKTTPSDNIVGAVINSFGDAASHSAKVLLTTSGCAFSGGAVGAWVSGGSSKNTPIYGNYQNLNEFINSHKN